MSRLALRNKAASKTKFPTQAYHRCPLCGRVRGFLRRFRMCRICFRLLSLRGEIPGVRKASW
ncbi:MAG TPA: type Z 30S ribosomal protein S14 [Nitrospiraceae bacterium]|nr:type Z 30S ribosomal protein S14 [Nitrospiraceae bacterium]HJR75930.1 type Z 30S ribosomal protein S14 [Nitrospiraceae bacterium]